jgi:hypothetical protein
MAADDGKDHYTLENRAAVRSDMVIQPEELISHRSSFLRSVGAVSHRFLS